MSGHHHHSHDVSGAPNHNLAFGTGIALNCGFVVLEIAFGITAHSTALIADAVHNLRVSRPGHFSPSPSQNRT